MISIPTKWRRNAMTIDMVEIITSRHPMYSPQRFLNHALYPPAYLWSWAMWPLVGALKCLKTGVPSTCCKHRVTVWFPKQRCQPAKLKKGKQNFKIEENRGGFSTIITEGKMQIDL